MPYVVFLFDAHCLMAYVYLLLLGDRSKMHEGLSNIFINGGTKHIFLKVEDRGQS